MINAQGPGLNRVRTTPVLLLGHHLLSQDEPTQNSPEGSVTRSIAGFDPLYIIDSRSRRLPYAGNTSRATSLSIFRQVVDEIEPL